jgi:hypothetical protein
MKKRVIAAVILFWLSAILILGATFLPDSFVEFVFDVYDTSRLCEIRVDGLIPSLRLLGVMLSLWGIGILRMKD